MTDISNRNDDETEVEQLDQAQEALPPASLAAIKISIVTLTLLAAVYTLYFAAGIILPFLLSILLNLLMQPARRLFCDRLHIPAPLTSLVLIAVLFSLVGGIGFAISLPASGWIAKAPQSIQTLQDRLSGLREPIRFIRNGATQLEHLLQQTDSGLGEDVARGYEGGHTARSAGAQTVQLEQPSNLGGMGLSILVGTQVALGQVFTVVIVLFFLLTSGDSLLRNLVEVIPGFRNKKRIVEISVEIERNVSGYLITITLINLIVGLVNGVAMWVFDVPDPLLWGALAFILNYIPIIGPLTGVVIFFFVGLFSFSSLGQAFIPAGVYLLVHVIEGETITPMLLARRFTLNPVVVILSFFFWLWLWGIFGALLSLPLLAILKIVCDRIPSMAPLGHMLGVPQSGRRRVGFAWRES